MFLVKQVSHQLILTLIILSISLVYSTTANSTKAVTDRTNCTIHNSMLTKLKPINDYPVVVIPEKPEKGESLIDGLFNTCITRVTDHKNEPPQGFARNDYSRRQALNSNETLLLVYAENGYWHLYDAENFNYVRTLSLGGADVEPQWHDSNPNILYKFPQNGGLVIMTHNVITDKVNVVADFRKLTSIYKHPGKTSIQEIWPSAARIWTKSEGSPSRDSRYWGLQVETSDFKSLGAITYDLRTNSITGIFDFVKDGNNIGRPDHISMSPSGKYVIPSWYVQECPNADSGTTTKPCGLMAYTRDFSSGYSLASRGEHSDIALDALGNDIVVMPNYISGYVEMYNIENKSRARLWRIYKNGSATALHVSGKAYNKPGWVLISTYATNGKPQWWTNKIMAVQLKKYPSVYMLSNTYNVDAGYWTEPHAVVNRDFTKVFFNSNWGSGDNDIDIYSITLPSNLIK